MDSRKSKYLKIKEVAEIFNVSIKEVYSWRTEGLPAELERPLRFFEEDVRRWLINRSKGKKR